MNTGIDQPLVSVLMTAYNREKYIGASIESVLASTYKNFELVIVDDCSADNTLAVAKQYASKDIRISVHRNDKNLGDYHNRNKAAAYARGKYIKYLDSDDIMYPHCLDVMVSAMEHFPGAGFGLSSISDANNPYPVCLEPHEIYMEHFNGYGHFNRAPGSSIILKNAFDKAGGFSGKRMIGDFEFWLAIAREYKMVKFPRDLVWDRTHTEQERQSDYAKQYETLRNDILNIALKSPGCPLTEAEIKKITKANTKQSIRKLLKKYGI